MKRRQEGWFGPHGLYPGVDVGKSFHWAVGPGQEGEIRISRRVENRLEDVDALLDEAGDAALVVVDQKNSIGFLEMRASSACSSECSFSLPAEGLLP